MEVYGNTRGDSQSDRNHPKRGGTTQNVTRRWLDYISRGRTNSIEKWKLGYVKKKKSSLSRFGGALPNSPNGDTAPGFVHEKPEKAMKFWNSNFQAWEKINKK